MRGCRDAQLLELPGGKTGSLQEGAGLGIEYAVALAVFPTGADDADGGTESRSGESACVTVGQDCAALGQQVFAKGSDAAIDLFVLVLNPLGLGKETGLYGGDVRFLAGDPEHSANGPLQVNGGGASGGDFCCGLFEAGEEGLQVIAGGLTGGQDHGVSRSNPDGGSAADAHGANGFDRVLIAADLNTDLLLGEPGLVEEFQLVTRPAYGPDFAQGSSPQVGGKQDKRPIKKLLTERSSSA